MGGYHHAAPAATVSTAIGRQFAEQALQHCLQAGLKINEVSQGSAPNTWAFKLAPMDGVSLGDEIWLSRHVISRLAERHHLAALFDAGLAAWATAARPGCRVKFSTDETRRPGGPGLVAIQQHIGRLQARHAHHLAAYANGGMPHVVGREFTCAFGNRSASVVIPSSTLLARGGHYVDQRPEANADPYVVCMALVSTTLGVPLPVMAAPPLRTLAIAAAAASKGAPQQQQQGGSGLAQSLRHATAACSWASRSIGTTMCTEDVLIDELRKLDAPVSGLSPSSTLMEGADECCSDGTSPDRSPPGSMDRMGNQPFLV